MKKPVKVLLYVIAATVTLLVAGVAYIVATFDPNEHKPRLIDLVKEKTGRTLAIPGDIKLTLFPRIGADLGQLSLTEPRSEQVFAAAQQMRVSVALLPLLRKDVQVDRVLVDGLSVKLARDARGGFNFDDLLPKGAPPTAPADRPAPAGSLPLLNIGGITLSNASVDYRDAANGQRLSVAKLNLSTGRIADGEKSQLDISADVQGSQPALDLRLTLQSDFQPALAEQKIRLENLSFKLLGSAAGQRDLQLLLALVGVDASAQRIDATGLSLELAAPNPGGGRLTLKAQGEASVDLAREVVQLALDGALDSTTLALKAGMQGFAQPAITFDLALGNLDIDRYLPKTPAASAKAPSAPAAGPEPVISLAPLRGLDLNGALKVAALKVMNIEAASVRLQLKAAGGRAELQPVTATLYGGGVNGNLYADAGSGQRLGAKLDLRGIQIGPLMKDALGQQPLDGSGNVALDLSTGGNTVSKFKQNLNGTVGVQLADGALNGVDIAGALRDVKARLGGGAAQGQAGVQAKTDFTEFVASLKITDGVARNDDLSAKTPLLRLGGAGTIYIAEDRLDYTLKTTVVPTLQGQGGPELEQLKGLTIPVRLSGPYSKIGWKIDFGGSAGSSLKEETREKLDAQKDEVRDKLKNLLKR